MGQQLLTRFFLSHLNTGTTFAVTQSLGKELVRMERLNKYANGDAMIVVQFFNRNRARRLEPLAVTHLTTVHFIPHLTIPHLATAMTHPITPYLLPQPLLTPISHLGLVMACQRMLLIASDNTTPGSTINRNAGIIDLTCLEEDPGYSEKYGCKLARYVCIGTTSTYCGTPT